MPGTPPRYRLSDQEKEDEFIGQPLAARPPPQRHLSQERHQADEGRSSSRPPFSAPRVPGGSLTLSRKVDKQRHGADTNDVRESNPMDDYVDDEVAPERQDSRSVQFGPARVASQPSAPTPPMLHPGTQPVGHPGRLFAGLSTPGNQLPSGISTAPAQATQTPRPWQAGRQATPFDGYFGRPLSGHAVSSAAVPASLTVPPATVVRGYQHAPQGTQQTHAQPQGRQQPIVYPQQLCTPRAASVAASPGGMISSSSGVFANTPGLVGGGSLTAPMQPRARSAVRSSSVAGAQVRESSLGYCYPSVTPSLPTPPLVLQPHQQPHQQQLHHLHQHRHAPQQQQQQQQQQQPTFYRQHPSPHPAINPLNPPMQASLRPTPTIVPTIVSSERMAAKRQSTDGSSGSSTAPPPLGSSLAVSSTGSAAEPDVRVVNPIVKAQRRPPQMVLPGEGDKSSSQSKPASTSGGPNQEGTGDRQECRPAAGEGPSCFKWPHATSRPVVQRTIASPDKSSLCKASDTASPGEVLPPDQLADKGSSAGRGVGTTSSRSSSAVVPSPYAAQVAASSAPAAATSTSNKVSQGLRCKAGRRVAAPNRRILVTGGSGLLGRQVVEALLRERWKVRALVKTRAAVLEDLFEGTSEGEDEDEDASRDAHLHLHHGEQSGRVQHRGKTDCEVVECDLKVEGTAAKQIEDFRPYAVLHLAGEWRPDQLATNPAAARKLNVDVTGEVAAACQRHGVAWMLFVSSDSVFDGEKGPYAEDDLASPISSFGWQKLHAEQLTMVACPRAAVLRLSLLYGPCDSVMDSAVTSLCSDLVDGVREVDAWQRCYPTWTPEVAKIIVKMLGIHAEGRGNELRGIFHWQGSECLTWHQMLAQVARLTSICDANRLVGVSAAPDVALPKDAKFRTSRLEALLGSWIPTARVSFQEGLATCLTNLLPDALDCQQKQERHSAVQLPRACPPPLKGTSAACSSFSSPGCTSSSPADLEPPALEESSSLTESEQKGILEQEQPKLLGKLRESSSLVWPSSSCDRWAFSHDASQADAKAAAAPSDGPWSSDTDFPPARARNSTSTSTSTNTCEGQRHTQPQSQSASWRLNFEPEKLPRRTAVFGSQGEHAPKEGGVSRPTEPEKAASSFSSPQHERFEEELKRRGAALQELFWQELERTRHRLKEAGPSCPTAVQNGATSFERGLEHRRGEPGSQNSSHGPLPKESVDWRSSRDPLRGLAAFGTPRHWSHTRVGECAS